MKMKTLTIAFVLLGALRVFSQEPDPDLFQTWYLTSYEYNAGEEIMVASITPSIYPFLIIDETLDFEGAAACNDYFGNLSYDSGSNTLNVVLINTTLTVCNFETHNEFELDYFEFFNNAISQPITYTIFEGSGIHHLDLEIPPGFILHYKNVPLSIEENDFGTEFQIWPNPVTNRLYIGVKGNGVDKVSIYSLYGQKIMTLYDVPESIDVSALQSGLYVLEFVTDKGKTLKKFIKK